MNGFGTWRSNGCIPFACHVRHDDEATEFRLHISYLN